MAKLFARNVEDFVCENCGATVTGNGYTNHCPHCLHSKHVDINPGDRASTCKGMMRPIGIENARDGYVIILQCTKCNCTKRNKSAENDDMDMIIKISSNRM